MATSPIVSKASGLGRKKQRQLTAFFESSLLSSGQFISCQRVVALPPCCSHLTPLWALFLHDWNWVAKSDPSQRYHEFCRSGSFLGFRCSSAIGFFLLPPSYLPPDLPSLALTSYLPTDCRPQTRLYEGALRCTGHGFLPSGTRQN